MKVLHLSTSDNSGGAAIAANRLHKALKENGIESYMLVQKKQSEDITIIGAKPGLFYRGINYLRNNIDNLPKKFYSERKETPWSVNWLPNYTLKRYIKKINPDIINLHWINGGFIPINDIEKIAKIRPVVWTLHDMWAFTGGCHLTGNCKKYISRCGKCPQLESKKTKDLSYRIFKRKTKRYNGLKLNIVSPSNWLKECAEKSKLLQKKKIQVIPNSLDTNIFKPVQKSIARKVLNLPDDKKIILFGAMNSISNKKKGFIYLKKALESLSKRNTDFLLVVFGASHDKDIEKLPFEIKFLGTLYDEYTLSLAYSASDVFVAPSEEDNLPNTILESFSCGTPCVAFEIGGFPDMIDYKKNGYLAKAFDFEDLAKGIDFCLSNSKLGLSARKKAEKEYSLERQAKQYKRLYKQLLK